MCKNKIDVILFKKNLYNIIMAIKIQISYLIKYKIEIITISK